MDLSKKIPLGIKLRNGLPYKVVIIDDSNMMRKLLEQILMSENFKVIADFESGQKAIDSYPEMAEKPNFAFVDIEMPGIDGIETVKQLKMIDSDLKYIMCTGVTDKEVVKQLLRLGISGYIVKPFDRKSVINRMATFIGRDGFSVD